MQLNTLIFDFCQDIKTLAYEEVLNALDFVTPKAKTVRPSKKGVRPVVSRVRKPMKPAVKEYLPYVSDDILQAVLGDLDPSESRSSQDIATAIKRGETTVRVALKHLVKRHVCAVHRDGKRTLYTRLKSA